MKEITITISKDGSKVETDAVGFSGSGCENSVEKLVGSLGDVTAMEKKMEFYEKEKTTLEQKV